MTVVQDLNAPTDVPRNGVLGVAQALMDRVNDLMALLSSVAIGVAGLVLTWEVAGRYFLAIPSDWQDELSAFLLIGATFASAAWTQARRGHVGIDALAHVLPAGLNHARRIFADSFACLFCGYFALKCLHLLLEAIQDGQTSSSAWGPPLWVPYSCMTVGMALLALQLGLQMLMLLGERRATTTA